MIDPIKWITNKINDICFYCVFFYLCMKYHRGAKVILEKEEKE